MQMSLSISTKSDLLKGYTQIFYIDFHDTFFHVARLEITILLLDIAAQKFWKLLQLDTKMHS